MSWPWSRPGRSPAERRKADEVLDEVRAEVRSLASELQRTLDRLERVERKVGVDDDGT